MHSKKQIELFILLGIILITLNLRGPITGVGPIIELIKEQYHLSSSLAGFITTLPLLAFAIFSPIVARFRYITTMFYGLLLIFLGEIIRSYFGEVGLFVGTSIMGVGIAVANVLLPSIIKSGFPKTFGKIMSIYSLVLVISAAIGAGISVPLALSLNLGWKNTLAVWSIVALIAVILWIPQLGGRRRYKNNKTHSSASVPIYKYATSWWITFFMGTQSLVFYSVIAWFPSILMDKGFDIHFASNMTLLYQICSMPVALFAPMMVARIRNKHKHLLTGFLCLMYAFAFGVLFFCDGLWSMVIATIFLAFPMGGMFGIALLFVSTKASHPQKVARLSGMAQSLGYLIAAIGPILLGFVYDLAHSWNVPLVLFVCLTLLLIFFGYKANNSKVI
ncbi:CynX/NimT family MFS transporter [Helicobacter cappadocius]|uniref:MFS transporter n=1 Tax=Helicobacter cappadocius TaxID=3063998 RepID=A0AA90PJN6_9HELI|nr:MULTISPECIES: MFS transporter [unclassified Helicobacter]MDO7253222.1 MFS transporter [Helicobacter sp. faydin-H75]MDP2539146.1 MFS transporter [Helicobacter sp. faydin-H76]